MKKLNGNALSLLGKRFFLFLFVFFQTLFHQKMMNAIESREFSCFQRIAEVKVYFLPVFLFSSSSEKLQLHFVKSIFYTFCIFCMWKGRNSSGSSVWVLPREFQIRKLFQCGKESEREKEKRAIFILVKHVRCVRDSPGDGKKCRVKENGGKFISSIK